MDAIVTDVDASMAHPEDGAVVSCATHSETDNLNNDPTASPEATDLVLTPDRQCLVITGSHEPGLVAGADADGYRVVVGDGGGMGIALQLTSDDGPYGFTELAL